SPDDYRLQVFSPVGYEYAAQVEVTWTDMQDQRREGHCVLEHALDLKFPRVVGWEKFVRGARELKILYDETLHIVLPQICSEQPPPRYTALVPQGGFDMDIERTAQLPHLAFLSEEEGEPLYRLLTDDEELPSPR
ncbi:hypothetical protein MRS77_22035, partial [Escherichia coli]|uniref:hypothetical protein n=1 Tax=Escherichia coli TaxID=562 RepID=UPI001FA712E1